MKTWTYLKRQNEQMNKTKASKMGQSGPKGSKVGSKGIEMGPNETKVV